MRTSEAGKDIELRPVIASYSGRSYRAVKEILDQNALGMVARVAQGSASRTELDAQVCAELVEMHVIKEEGDRVQLDTAVFLEEDLVQVQRFASRYGKELARLVAGEAAPLRLAPPAVANFLVGMIGIVQSTGHAVREAKLTVEWWNYAGKYASCKVDFDQVCPASTSAGPDLLNKRIQRGERYTAVFTGPGGAIYPFQVPAGDSGSPPEYTVQINAYLTDAFAMLLTGQVEHPALRAAAGHAGLLRDGVPEAPVLTNETVQEFLPAIQNIRRLAREHFLGELPAIRDLLGSTASGRQGVPFENMQMHLWRYLRRVAAKELYAAGVFTDRIPETGVITLFYENGIGILDELLS